MDHDPDYFERWLKATLTPLEKPHWLERKRMAEYHASPGCNGSTFLFDTPAEMKQAAEKLPEINYAFALGDAFHIATLEPDRFDADHGEEEFFQYSVTKTLDTKANAEAFAADPSKPIVTTALIDKARYMRDAVMKNHFAKRLLSAKADTELSGYVWDNDVQVIKKVRIDFRPKNGNFLADLKSCQSVNEMKFWSDVKKFKYGAKCAYYLDCEAEISNKAVRPLFYLIAVQGPKAENKGPKDDIYAARVFEIASPVAELSLVEEGRAFYRDRLGKFSHAARYNDWTAYEDQSEAEVLTTFRPRSFFKSKQPAEDDDS
jgi:hypothetical protein